MEAKYIERRQIQPHREKGTKGLKFNPFVPFNSCFGNYLDHHGSIQKQPLNSGDLLFDPYPGNQPLDLRQAGTAWVPALNRAPMLTTLAQLGYLEKLRIRTTFALSQSKVERTTTGTCRGNSPFVVRQAHHERTC